MTNKFHLAKVMGLFHLFWQVIFFAIPLLFLFWVSLNNYEMGLPTGKLTFHNYEKLVNEPLFYKALMNTLLLGVTVSIISTLLALFTTLIAWLFRSSVIRNIFLYASIIVFFIGLIPRTFVLQYLISEQGPVNSLLNHLGLNHFPFELYSFGGIVLGYLPVFVPLSLIILLVARKEISQEFVYVARELGGSFFKIQIDIIIPLIKTAIFTSFSLIFLLTIADVVVINLIGGSRIYSVSSLILDYIKIDNWGLAAGTSFIFLLIIAIFLFLTSKIFLKKAI